MRKLHVVALVSLCSLSALFGGAGCSKAKDGAPGTPEVTATGTPATPTVGGAAGTATSAAPTAPPSFVVYTGESSGVRTVGATIEDGTAPPVALSTSGVDTTFAGVVSGRRALLVEHKADKSIDAVVAIRGDGTARTSLASFPAGKYAELKQVRSEGDAVVVEASRVGGAATDVLALRAGAAPRVLAVDSTLVAVSATRAAVMTAGNLRAFALDGAGVPAPLGAENGKDRVAEVMGSRILLTMHGATSDDVRAINLDGSNPIAFGKPETDETAFAFAGATRVVFVRKGEGGSSLVSAAISGKDEKVIAPAAADLSPIQVTAAGDLLYRAGTTLYAAPVNGGAAARVLDPSVGQSTQIGTVQDGLVVYRTESTNGPALRVVKLDGSGLKSLCEGVPQIPFFAGMTTSGRVVYYRALASQQEGGRLFTIKTDGTDLRPIGTGVLGGDGKPMAVADQDFETRTPAGRLILESEFVTNGGSQLVVASHDTDNAKLLAGASHVRFAALIP